MIESARPPIEASQQPHASVNLTAPNKQGSNLQVLVTHELNPSAGLGPAPVGSRQPQTTTNMDKVPIVVPNLNF